MPFQESFHHLHVLTPDFHDQFRLKSAERLFKTMQNLKLCLLHVNLYPIQAPQLKVMNKQVIHSLCPNINRFVITGSIHTKLRRRASNIKLQLAAFTNVDKTSVKVPTVASKIVPALAKVSAAHVLLTSVTLVTSKIQHTSGNNFILVHWI